MLNFASKQTHLAMTRMLRTILLGLALSLISQATFAQYSTTLSMQTDAPTLATEHHGQGLANTGKALMFTGASVALTSIAFGTIGWLTYDTNSTINLRGLYPVLSILGCAAGGAVALVGVPFYCTGSYKMNRNGTSLLRLSGESARGGTGIVELGAGLGNYIAIDAIGGYNVNNWLFVGAGMGYNTQLTFGDAPRDKSDWILPIYGNLRANFGSKCVTPYISTRIGYDINQSNLYTGIEFGTRIRTANSQRGTSWWVATKTECLGNEIHSVLFTAGKSF